MANKSEGSGASGGDEASQLSAMRSSPSAGGMRLAGNYAQRGSPGVVRRAASRPISIIRSTSVPTQLQDGSHQQAVPSVGGGSGGNATTSKRGLHVRDRSLQHDFNFNSSAGAGLGGVVQSLPIPKAPMLACSLPPSRILDDLPPLSLPPQADVESFKRGCGALSTSWRENRLYATSCPATLGGHFGRPPEQMSDMAVVEEGSHDEEHEGAARPREIKSVTALSILKSSAKAAAAPDSEKTAEEDAESVETSDESDGEQDVFNMEGLERVSEELNALCLSEASIQQG